MKRRTVWSVAVVLLASALALNGCGGSSPSSPSGKGVALQGTVINSIGAAGVSAHAGSSANASGKMVVTVQQNPAISATVNANGTFELEDLPAGTITLVFTIDGTVVGTITIEGVPEGAEVEVVVQITPDGAILISIEISGLASPSPNPSPGASPGTSTCLISGGTANTNIELEGKVASGTTSMFKLDVQGNRASKLVDVSTGAGTSWVCVGQSGDCKNDATLPGRQVHVRGLLATCTMDVALVNATEVKVQK